MGTQPARRTGWLYQLPPWRAPRIRRHHHHHHHDLSASLVDGVGAVIGRTLLAAIFVEIWCAEISLWVLVWFYYGLFLGARWVWRHNPIGQTIDSVYAARERRQPTPYDPHRAPPQPVDLAQLGNTGTAPRTTT